MKKITLTLILLLLTSFSFAENQIAKKNSDNLSEETFEKAVYPQKINPWHGFSRGIINIATCWLEIPREIILENNKFPVVGIVSGALKGTFFTTTRAVLSVVDVGLLGFTGPSGYDPNLFPEYVWNSQWNPFSKNEITEILNQKEDFKLQPVSLGRQDDKVFSIH